MAKWLKSGTDTIVDTAVSGITVEGDYYLLANLMDQSRTFAFGASTRTATHTATVQLWVEVSGVRTNLDSALVPVFGTPAASAKEYTCTGWQGITVSGLTGAVYPEALQ